LRFLKENACHVWRDVALPDGGVPAGPHGGWLAIGAPRASDIDDVDVAPSGDGDEEGTKLCVLTFEDPAQLHPEVWPEDWQYVSVEACDLGRQGREYKSVPGGGGGFIFFARFYWGLGGIFVG